MSSAWSLFPFPTLADAIEDGCLIEAPSTCRNCQLRPCTATDEPPLGDLKTCPFGIDYLRLDASRLLVGVIATDLPTRTKRSLREARRNPKSRVKASDVKRAATSLAAVDRAILVDFEQNREHYIEQTLSSPEVQDSILRELRGQLAENLNQSHDFVQLITMIKNRAAALLEEARPGLPTIQAAELPELRALGSIYFATELLRGKIDATLFLNEPNRAYGGEVAFEVHRMITKYFRIYRWQADQKNMAFTTKGTCFAQVVYRPEAIGVVVQALLDNLVKYAPAESSAEIGFSESDDIVTVDFRSLGPKIEGSEIPRIFTPGFRAAAARQYEPSGLGFGLAAAKSISDTLDLHLSVHQELIEDPTAKGRYATTFSVRMKKRGH